MKQAKKSKPIRWRKVTVGVMSLGIVVMVGVSINTWLEYHERHETKVMTVPDATNSVSKKSDVEKSGTSTESSEISSQKLDEAKYQIKGLFSHLIEQSETGEFRTSTPEQIYKKWGHKYVVPTLNNSTLIITPYGKQVHITDSDIELGDASNDQVMQLLVYVDSKFNKETYLFTYDASQQKITDYKQFTISRKASVTENAN